MLSYYIFEGIFLTLQAEGSVEPLARLAPPVMHLAPPALPARPPGVPHGPLGGRRAGRPTGVEQAVLR